MGITHRIVRPQEEEEGGRGHRKAQHPADLRIEAWGPTREDCIAEAVRGLVDSFAVVAGLPLHARAERHMTAGCDEDLLASVIDEVIYWLDADGEIPLSVAARPTPDGGVVVFLVFARSADTEITSAVPKAASPRDHRPAGSGGPVATRGHGRRVPSRRAGQPLMTPSGTSRATFRHSPAPSAAWTTSVTSL